MSGGDDTISDFLLFAYCCILFQPSLVYDNQSQVLMATRGYQYKHSCEQNSQATEEEYRHVCWSRRHNSLRVMWSGLIQQISFHGLSTVNHFTDQNFITCSMHSLSRLFEICSHGRYTKGSYDSVNFLTNY
jgi:hypothetical protein